MRIDKWLWSVRIFKSRSLAAQECLKGRVILEGFEVKPSRVIKPGDVVMVKKPPFIFTYRVKELTERRVGAKILSDYLENLTPEEELRKLESIRFAGFKDRDRGTGRPTKKERRMLDDFTTPEE